MMKQCLTWSLSAGLDETNRIDYWKGSFGMTMNFYERFRSDVRRSAEGPLITASEAASSIHYESPQRSARIDGRSLSERPEL
ncbi:hypothetical protein AAFF_G00146390 [Aldrovandia affinis]|uniref:Uncharacterized protein n=1 Tax=Aldrovandia affinis TaxID=143900 RepID=A0AAD7RPQ4_9TELE|nr:hypothetical protein AAFF_G00146390 [Aldrovandia affinis]